MIENLIASVPEGTSAWFYRTAAGAEVDLLLQLPKGELWAIEIKLGTAPKVRKGFHNAREDLKPARSFVVYGEEERFPLADGIDAISLLGLTRELRSLQ